MSDKQDELRPIIIKKVKKGGHGHHGGAWKVAYADFVTAMMAFFLLLWLLSVTTEVQKEGIADYFTSKPVVTRSESGAGGVMGGTTISPDGAQTSMVKPLVEREATQDPAMTSTQNISDKRFEEELKRRERKNFEKAKKALQKAISASPELQDMKKALKIDMTDEGLRIQIADDKTKPLFTSGSAVMLPHTKLLLKKVAGVIQKLPNEISVRGHTDSVPYGVNSSYTNWELSADRANSARRQLIKGGMPTPRINNVVGKADTDHLFPKKPRDGRNRRISIILLHETLTTKEGANKSTRATAKQEATKKELYRKTEGKVSFP
jgi:chemotaxis protein MotB